MRSAIARVLVVLVALFAGGGAATAQTQVGTAERVSGGVSAVGTDNLPRPLRVSDPVNEGETVVTGENGEVLLRMVDNATIALRPNSLLRLVEIRNTQSPNDSFVVSLLRGAMRSVTGLIGRTAQRRVRYITPTSTVGIRGTDLEILIVEQESPTVRAGTYNYVNDGSTSLEIPSGQSVDVQQDETGLALANPQPGEAALQVLRGRPAFLRGGGFDALMLQLTRPPIIIPPRIR